MRVSSDTASYDNMSTMVLYKSIGDMLLCYNNNFGLYVSPNNLSPSMFYETASVSIPAMPSQDIMKTAPSLMITSAELSKKVLLASKEGT